MLTSVSAFPDHFTAQVLLSWRIGGGGGGKVQLFQQQIFFNKKKTRIPDIFRYFKNPPGLIYSDQKGGHVRVEPDYMVNLCTQQTIASFKIPSPHVHTHRVYRESSKYAFMFFLIYLYCIPYGELTLKMRGVP